MYFRSGKLRIRDPSNIRSFVITGSDGMSTDRHVILPALSENDTVLFATQTQIITNKILDYNNNTLLNFPVATGDVTLKGEQTLTNKNLTSPVINDPTIYLNSANALNIRTTTAGAVGIEFGSNNATGGDAFMDWHISSGDGDFSTRLVRYSGANSAFRIIQSGNNGTEFWPSADGTVDASISGGLPKNTYFPAIITKTKSTDVSPYYNIFTDSFYRATDLSAGSPFNLGLIANLTNLTYGTSLIAPYGSNIANATNVVVANSGTYQNEIANYYGSQVSQNGARCSHWFTDWTLLGPVAQQPGMLQGISLVVNNYYNGSPVRMPASTMMTLLSYPGAGGGMDAEHNSATAYKVDVGLNIAGIAGTLASPTRGIETGILIGQSISAWTGSSAVDTRVGTGIKILDFESGGIVLDTPAASATRPVGIRFNSSATAYTSLIDTSDNSCTTVMKVADCQAIVGVSSKIIISSGGNTVDIQSIGTDHFVMLRLLSTYATVPTNAITSILRLKNSTDATNEEYLEFLAFGTSGYYVQSQKSGNGMIRNLTIRAGGGDAIVFNGDSNTTTVVAPTTFNDRALILKNSDNTFSTTLRAGAQTADNTFTFPVTTSDTIITAAAPQTISHKTIDSSLNTLVNVEQSPIVKRTGSYQPAAGTTAMTVGYLQGILSQHTPTGAGSSNTNTFDITEGVVINLVSATSSGVNAGLVSPTAGVGIGRRLFGCKAVIRWKIDSTISARMYFGFTSATALPISDMPIANTDSGVVVGFRATDKDFTVISNDGNGTATARSLGVAKDANFHTMEINWTPSGSVNVILDGARTTTISTVRDLPAPTANLFFNAVVQTTSINARTTTIHGIWIECDK
jgi:hypothetical protein